MFQEEPPPRSCCCLGATGETGHGLQTGNPFRPPTPTRFPPPLTLPAPSPAPGDCFQEGAGHLGPTSVSPHLSALSGSKPCLLLQGVTGGLLSLPSRAIYQGFPGTSGSASGLGHPFPQVFRTSQLAGGPKLRGRGKGGGGILHTGQGDVWSPVQSPCTTWPCCLDSGEMGQLGEAGWLPAD